MDWIDREALWIKVFGLHLARTSGLLNETAKQGVTLSHPGRRERPDGVMA